MAKRDLQSTENIIAEEDDGFEGKQPQVTKSMDENLYLFMARKRQPKPKQKYVFLSVKDTETTGKFSEKYKGERENKDIPQPYQGNMPKSYSALGGMISASPDPSKSCKFYCNTKLKKINCLLHVLILDLIQIVIHVPEVCILVPVVFCCVYHL